MVKYGLTPARAIRSATSDAAELLGKSRSVGKIAPGMYADLIAVEKDPLANIRNLETVAFVMKGGSVIKNEIKGTNLSNRQVKVSTIRAKPRVQQEQQSIVVPGANRDSPR